MQLEYGEEHSILLYFPLLQILAMADSTYNDNYIFVQSVSNAEELM